MEDDTGNPDGNRPGTDPEDDWCSINEAARRLGVTPTAIRNRIKRGTLKTKPNGNFGRLVRVPRPVPPTVMPTVTVTEPEPVTETLLETVAGTVMVTVLEHHIKRLEAELAAVSEERDTERARAAQVDVLKAVLEAEQRRSTELRDERDKWHAAATAPRGLMSWFRRVA